jgi:hypothetical protein
VKIEKIHLIGNLTRTVTDISKNVVTGVERQVFRTGNENMEDNNETFLK